MAETAEAGPKLCMSCGQDCTGKPRSRDAQGRYMCKACVDARAAAAPATPASPRPAAAPAKAAAPRAGRPAPEDDGGMMAALIDSAKSQQGAPCPQCGVPMGKNAVLCTRCGFNTEMGAAVKTKILRAPKERSQSSGPSAASQLLSSPLAMFVGIFAITAGLPALGFVDPMFALVGLIGAGLVAGVIQLLLIFAAFKDDHRIWGWTMLAGMFLGFAGFVMLWYGFMKCERPTLKAAFAGSFLGAIVAIAIVFSGAIPGLLDEESSITPSEPAIVETESTSQPPASP